MADELATLADSLGWTLLHSVWQVALIAGIAAIALRLTSRDNPQLRFAIAYLGLVGTLVAFAVTFAVYALPGSASATTLMTAVVAEAGSPALVDTLGRATPLVSLAWLLGFALLCVRYFGALRETQRLRTEDVSPVPSLWEARFRLWVERLGADANTIIRESARISTPLTIGSLKPIVLVPAGFFLRLPAEQAEAILAHELAHICRQDYLLGLVQAMIRNIFFFHPAIYWLSRQVDAEREYACDARVVAETGDACALAKGLGQVALESGIARHGFAVAADGSGIKNRIRRLRERREGGGGASVPTAAIGSVFAAALIVALGADAAIRPSIAEPQQWDERSVSRITYVPAGSGPVIQVTARVAEGEAAAATAHRQPKAEPETAMPAVSPKANGRAAPSSPESAIPVAAGPAEPARFVLAVATPNMLAERVAAFRTAAYQTGEDDDADCPDKDGELEARLEREAERRERRLERERERREARLERQAEQREAMLERRQRQREASLERQQAQREAMLARAEAYRERELARAEALRERELQRAEAFRERRLQELEHMREQLEQRFEGMGDAAGVRTLTISLSGPEANSPTELLRLVVGTGATTG